MEQWNLIYVVYWNYELRKYEDSGNNVIAKIKKQLKEIIIKDIQTELKERYEQKFCSNNYILYKRI